MIVIDASVWVSFLAPQDVFHAPTRTWMEPWRVAKEPMLSPVILLAEVGGAFVRRFSNPDLGYEAINGIRGFPDVHLIPIDRELGDLAADLAASLRLRGADATYVAVAHAYDIPLVTWDQELLMRTAAAIQTYTPHTAPARR
ncbi:MAG TPA: type II toxin-antitoxin system VapC family toxin [Thermomicrobiales bacterium]|nr:type II toxin-antitoxin system VapC family toxin [Thermomicrobiales bacterium]